MAELLERSFTPGAGAVSFGSHRYEAALGHVLPFGAEDRVAGAHSALFGVALGDPDVEGARLEACVEWLSAHFARCAVAIGDTLYRLTLAALHGVDEEDARERALAAGRTFSETYAPLFRQYSDRCAFEIIPLSSLATHPDYARHHAALAARAQSDAGLRDAIEAIAPRWIGTLEDLDGRRLPSAGAAWQLAEKYLVEEGAALAVLASHGWPLLIQSGAIDRLASMVEGGAVSGAPIGDMALGSLKLLKRGLFFADGSAKVIHRSSSASAKAAAAADGEFLGGFDDNAWNWLLSGMSTDRYTEGQTIIEAGDDDRRLCLLVDGRAEVSVLRADGTHQQIAILEAGTVMGEQSFIDGQPRSARVTALTPCTVRSIDARAFGRLKVDDPHLALEVLTDLARIISLRSRRVLFEMQNLP